MTSGSWSRNSRIPMISFPATGPIKVGLVTSKTWNGSDAIKANTPRSSFPKVNRRPRARKREDRFVYSWKFNKELRRLVSTRHTKAGKYLPLPIVVRPVKPVKPRKKKVVLPPMPYTMTKTTEFVCPALVSQQGPSGPVDTYTGCVDPFVTPSYDPSQDYRLIEKLRAKVYGSGFNPAVFMAEGREALDMIGGNATRIRLGIGALIKKDWRGVAAALSIQPDGSMRKLVKNPRKTVSSKWLELQYGWLPLVSDMEEGAKWIAEQNTLYNTSNSVRASRSYEVDQRYKPLAGQHAYSRCIRTFHTRLIVYGYSKTPTYQPSLATAATVAWEKLPYSFVADWAIPIGSYLQSLRTAADLSGKFVKTVFLESKWLDARFTSTPTYAFKGYASPGGPWKKSWVVDRTVTDELVVKNPLGSLATDASFMSWRRCFNAVALLAQRKWFASGSNH